MPKRRTANSPDSYRYATRHSEKHKQNMLMDRKNLSSWPQAQFDTWLYLREPVFLWNLLIFFHHIIPHGEPLVEFVRDPTEISDSPILEARWIWTSSTTTTKNGFKTEHFIFSKCCWFITQRSLVPSRSAPSHADSERAALFSSTAQGLKRKPQRLYLSVRGVCSGDDLDEITHPERLTPAPRL